MTKAITPPPGPDPIATAMCEGNGHGTYYPNYEVIRYGPYLQTTWHNIDGYNDALPFEGCSSTINQKLPHSRATIAAGQLMKYFGRPTSIS